MFLSKDTVSVTQIFGDMIFNNNNKNEFSVKS